MRTPSPTLVLVYNSHPQQTHYNHIHNYNGASLNTESPQQNNDHSGALQERRRN